MVPDSKVVDAPPHKITALQTIEMARDYEFVVLFTSSLGLSIDLKIAEMMKDANPKLKVAFVGPPVTIDPETAIRNSAVDFVVRREFDRQVVEYANGKSLHHLAGVSFRNNGSITHNPDGVPIENLDELPWVTKTGSEQEFEGAAILRGFLGLLKFDEFSIGHGHAFGLQQ
jgi:hypothetical protein